MKAAVRSLELESHHIGIRPDDALAEVPTDETARSKEVEGPGSMKPSTGIDLKAVLLQASVDFFHPLPALLDEAEVERPLFT